MNRLKPLIQVASAVAALLSLVACTTASPSSQTTAAPAVVPLFAVDYAALSAEAASVCEQRAKGTGERIRQAHDRWQVPNRAAQERSLRWVLEHSLAEQPSGGPAVASLPERRTRWREQSLQDLRALMLRHDAASIRIYCERWPALFERTDMQFAAMANTAGTGQPPRANFMLDHRAEFEEAARLCDARVPGSGTSIHSAVLRWQAVHGDAKDQLMAWSHASASQRAELVGGRVLTLVSIQAHQRFQAIARQRQAIAAMPDEAVRAHCQALPGRLERSDFDFVAAWAAVKRAGL